MDEALPDPDGQSLYRAALRLLSPFEKDKLICMLFHGNMTFTDVNWDALATTLGFKDGGTMYLQINKIMKKVEEGAMNLPEGDGLRTAYKAKRKRPKDAASTAATEDATKGGASAAVPESSLRAGSTGKSDAASGDEAGSKRAKGNCATPVTGIPKKRREAVSTVGKKQSDTATELASDKTDEKEGEIVTVDS